MVSAIHSTHQPLVLVRHGESTWNELKLVQGQNNEAQLNGRGREQANAAVTSLRAYDFDVILSSDLTRALQTAQVFAHALDLEIVTAAALRERSFGDLEGRGLSELTSSLSGIADHVVIDDEVHPPGGESLRDLHQRVGEFIETIRDQRPGERLLLVTHGGTIHAIRAFCVGLTMQHLDWDRVANCSIWTV
jgi:probable phosphoglycerate mutase